MLRAMMLALCLALGQSVYAQQENSVDKSGTENVAETASEAAEDDETAKVINALSGFRETIDSATDEIKTILEEIDGRKMTKDEVKERFTTVINGIQTSLKKLQPGSDLDNAISDLIGLADYQIEELQRLGDDYDEVVKGWNQLRSDIKAISFQIKENREILSDQLTQIVRKEQFIIQILKLRRAKQAVIELKKVVNALSNVREKLKKWTVDAEKSINLTDGKDAENSPSAGKAAQ